MVKLVKAKFGDDVVLCYPLARFTQNVGFEKVEKKKVEQHKFLFFKWEKEIIEQVQEDIDKPCYLVYISKEKMVDCILVEDLLEPIDDIMDSWVKCSSFISKLPKGYAPDDFLVKDFFGEKFILDRNEFMSLWDGMEEKEYLVILFQEKPELFA